MLILHVFCLYKKILRGEICFNENIQGVGEHSDFGKYLILMAVLSIGTDLLIVLFFFS